MKTNKIKLPKRLVALLLSIITLVTSIPLSPIIASASQSGQLDVINGNNYGLKSNCIYPYGSVSIPTYHRGCVPNGTGNNTNLLQKYISQGQGGYGKQQNGNDIPVFRITRSGGFTNPDTTVESISCVTTNYGGDLLNCVNSDVPYTLDGYTAGMIQRVLRYGCKQSIYNSYNANDSWYNGWSYANEQLYFLATQAIIWEIQEGRRRDWDNSDAGYYNSYNHQINHATYWREYYYDCYDNHFCKYYNGLPDHYNEILNACAMDEYYLKYGYYDDWNNYHDGNYFGSEPGSAQLRMDYGKDDDSKFDYHYKDIWVNWRYLGEGEGLYDINDIVLPFGKKIPQDGVYHENKGWINGAWAYDGPSKNTAWRWIDAQSVTLLGITVDRQWVYVRSNEGEFYIGSDSFPNWKYEALKSPVNFKYLGGGGLQFWIYNDYCYWDEMTGWDKIADGDWWYNIPIMWRKNVSNIYNEPYFYGTDSSSSYNNAFRGYVSCGNGGEETSYLNLWLYKVKVEYTCEFWWEEKDTCLDTSISVPYGYVLRK